MKVQLKRAFKSYFFSVAIKALNQTGSAWNFFQLPIQIGVASSISYFKINALSFFCPLFFKEYHNLEIIEMVSEQKVDLPR